MEWQPAQGTQPLAPFDHQVAGQSSMLRYDATTVCKPLIAREHFVYKTLPEALQEFTPDYRGEVEVQLQEEDGYIQLYGKSVGNDSADVVCQCSSETADLEQMDVRPKAIAKPLEETSSQNKCVIRVLRSGSYEVCHESDEVFFTKDSTSHHPHTQNLNPWSLKNHKRLLDKMRKSEHSHNKIRFILLKNVVADFRHPCILDLKIGSRLHGDDASHKKVASQSTKCSQTTSSTLGVRLCGMQVYQVDSGAYHSVDKYHGRTLNKESFRHMLYDFLHNGTRFRTELIRPIVTRLSELIKCLQGLSSFRFYASSLLIIYDGYVSNSSNHSNKELQIAASPDTADSTPDEPVNDSLHFSQKFHPKASTTSESSLGCDINSDNFSTSLHASNINPSEQCTHDSEACHLCSKAKHVNDYTTPPHLNNKSVKEGDHLGNVPAVLNDVLHVNNLSAPHSFQPVPSGTLSHVDAVNSNQSTTKVLGQSLGTNKDSVLDNEKHLLSSKWDQNIDDNDKWLRSHIISPDSGLANSLNEFSGQSSLHSEAHTGLLDNQGPELTSRITDKDDLTERGQIHSHNMKPDNLRHSEFKNSENAGFSNTQGHPFVRKSQVSKSQEQPHGRSVITLGERDFSSQNHEKTIAAHLSFQDQANSLSLLEQPTSAHMSSHYPHSEISKVALEKVTRISPEEEQELHEDSVKVDVKMIDFAHTTHSGFTSDKVKHTGPDTDYIQGLQNLMDLFQMLHQDS